MKRFVIVGHRLAQYSLYTLGASLFYARFLWSYLEGNMRGGGRTLAVVSVTPIIITLMIIFTLKECFYLVKLDGERILIRNIYGKFLVLKWSEIVDVYSYQFNGVENIQFPHITKHGPPFKLRRWGPYHVGGLHIFVPRKMPQRWIFIDDGRGDNGDNIFEYLLPLRKGSIMRIKHSDRLLAAIKEHYPGEIVEKTIELGDGCA